MQKYLMSFVKTGNPNTLWADDKPIWPKYTDDNGTMQQLVFNNADDFYVGQDDLLTAGNMYWNLGLWF